MKRYTKQLFSLNKPVSRFLGAHISNLSVWLFALSMMNLFGGVILFGNGRFLTAFNAFATAAIFAAPLLIEFEQTSDEV